MEDTGEVVNQSDDKPIRPGYVFTHKETGREFKVVAVGQMKPEDGTWIPAVTFESLLHPEKVFTRSEAAFREKFSRGVIGTGK